jgi:hypothetical protein
VPARADVGRHDAPLHTPHVPRRRPAAGATVVAVTTSTRTPRTRLVRSVSALLLAGTVAVGLTACGEGSMIDNVVGSAVDQGVESVRGTVEDAVGEAVGDVLGGASVSTDGTLPETFPAEVPLLDGTVRGGGAGPEGTGWVAQLTAGSLDDFAAAQAQLEVAGYTASGVNVDGDTALGTFTGDAYRVLLTLTSQSSDGAVVATYVVTPL